MFSYVLLVHVRKRRIFEEAVLVDELFEFLSVIALLVLKKKLEELVIAFWPDGEDALSMAKQELVA